MKRKIGIIGVAITLLVSVLGPAPAQAASNITVQSSTAQVIFPTTLSFNISATDSVNITDIRLRYVVKKESFANSFSESFVVFQPSSNVKASWTMDMQRTGGLPTGTTVNYWWVIKDASGQKLETQQQTVDFSDNRYKWQSTNQGNVTLYWYQGDAAFASTLMTTAQGALTRLESTTGANLTRPIRIYIYANAQDLQGSMIFSSEWTGGVSFVEYAIINIGIAPGNLEWGKRAMSHELTHLAIHQITFNPYGDLPTWLDEGLAVYNEGPADPNFAAMLTQAAKTNTLLTMRTLTSPFSAYSSEATLSYSESYSFVNYLVANYGQAKMGQLLNVFQQGSAYDDAFQKVYGMNMDQIYTQWKTKTTSAALLNDNVYAAPAGALVGAQ